MEKFDSILPSEISIHDGHHQRLKIDKLMPASRHFVWPKTTIVVILRFTGTLNCVHNFLLDIIWMVSFAAKIWRYWKLLLCHKRCHKRCTIRFLPFPPPFSLPRLIFLFLHLSLSLSLSLSFFNKMMKLQSVKERKSRRLEMIFVHSTTTTTNKKWPWKRTKT